MILNIDAELDGVQSARPPFLLSLVARLGAFPRPLLGERIHQKDLLKALLLIAMFQVSEG